MTDTEKSKNLQFCFYYKGEEECPYNSNSPDFDKDAGFAWMSESICCRVCGDDVNKFLDLICTHMGKWDPYSYVERFSRYLLANTTIPLEMRVSYAEKNFVKNHPLINELKRPKMQKPKGRPVFEYYWEGGFPCRKEGYLLYFDGRVYTVSENICEGEEEHYDLVTICKPLADEVKAFIKENQARIDALPEEIPGDYMVCDGSSDHYKFLSKKTEGYMIPDQGAGKDLRALHDEIIEMFRKRGVEARPEEKETSFK